MTTPAPARLTHSPRLPHPPHRPMKTVLSLSALAVGGLITGAVLYAGPLDPPAGPVAPTFKTLAEVEPRIAINLANTPGDADSRFKITQPGSYYLTGNITGVVGRHGIEIAASGVTLDLNGFDLVGVPAMGAFDGVVQNTASLRNVAVRNGSVRSWGRDGINLGSFGVSGCRVEDVRAADNTRIGIRAGFNAVVSDCATSGGQEGVNVLDGSSVTRCTATGTSNWGINAGAGSTVANCTADANAGIGIFLVGGGTVTDCSARANTGNGIEVGLGCEVANSSAVSNSADGIRTDSGCTITTCSASQNGDSGIRTIDGCTVIACTVALNAVNGIEVGVGCTIADCTSRANSSHGIRSSSESVIRGNTCSTNGNGGLGAGISTVGSDSRIEGNNCTGADGGIVVNDSGNIIIKNTCSGNTTNWSIFAGNRYGPILNLTAGGTPPVSGDNSISSTVGTSDAWANFSY